MLVQPPLEDFYATPMRLYPLGLLYVAKILEDANFVVDVLDCLAHLKKRRLPIPGNFSYLEPFTQNPYFFKGYYRFGISEEMILTKIREFSPDLIGISSQFTAYYQSVHNLASLIKKNFNIPIFIGGNHATAFPQEIKRRTPEIDSVLAGPAEDCLPEFLASLGNISRKEKIDWRLIQPSHHMLEGKDYEIGKKNYISLIASRGCPYRCEFCSAHQMFGRKIQYREIDEVLKEMRWNYIHKDTRIFNFEDDNLSFDRRWFLQFLQEVSADLMLKGIELTAMNGLCPPTLDEEVLEKMWRAGFRRLNLSFVTQSEELRQKYQRPQPSESFKTILRVAKNLCFLVTVYVIIGLPGQTYGEIKASIDYLLDLGVFVGPSVFYLPPGSMLYERLKIGPEIKDNWNFYRSSAFAIKTDELSRSQLIELFLYARQKNLERKN